MQAKVSKFIAAIIALVIIYANSWSVVSYAAEVFLSEKELENQNTTSKDGSVDFDVQYTNGKHSATLNIDEKNTKLNIAVSLKKSGYVKDLAIDFSSSNFEIDQINDENTNENGNAAQTTVAKKIQNFDAENKKITFGQITNKEQISEQIYINPIIKEEIGEDNFSRDNKIKLTCTFVNTDAKETKVEKEIVLHTEWTAQNVETELNYETIKYIPYASNEENKIIVQGKVTTNVKNYVLPVKKTNINISIPQIAGEYPEKVSVINNTEEITKELNKENITYDEKGMKKLFKQFSFPCGISSHVAPETPGSINEGGELGYSLAHAYGAVMDNPTLIAACVVGDGEAETGPLATSWHSNKFINPKTDGTVLPILHLNGYKINNPTIFSRMSDTERNAYFLGCGYKVYHVSGNDTMTIHERMAKTLDKVVRDIKKIKQSKSKNRPLWPMIILETPKGWTGPKKYEGKVIEGTYRAHQIPINVSDQKSLKALEDWLLSYHPEELFDKNGTLIKELRDMHPKGIKRMGANPNANGGLLLNELIVPEYNNFAIYVPYPGAICGEDMRNLGKFVRDIIAENKNNFRVFGPDEAASNRLTAMFEKTNKRWIDKKLKTDDYLSNDGRVMDAMLSEHLCEGWLEGYLLTGRHGFFNSYESFIRVIDSMASQHAKWLKVCNELSFSAPISSLNYVLTSNVWQQDHNGYTHQDPGFINHIVTKKADIVRVYLPPDTNTLLCCFNHIIKTKNYINLIKILKKKKKIKKLKKIIIIIIF